MPKPKELKEGDKVEVTVSRFDPLYNAEADKLIEAMGGSPALPPESIEMQVLGPAVSRVVAEVGSLQLTETVIQVARVQPQAPEVSPEEPSEPTK